MSTIHLMTGFIGFGKTTIAKALEESVKAVRLTHDEFMVKLYGRNMHCKEFHINYNKVDDILWTLAEKIIKSGSDVIMDYGFWSHENRKNAYNRAIKISDDVLFHNVNCEISTAEERVLKRSAENPEQLQISEDEFEALLTRFEQWNEQDNYPVVLYNCSNNEYIGKVVKVKIDRPKGSKHPKFGFEYPVNYGYIPFTMSGDGEELDAYVLAVNEPLDEFIGQCIAVIHRTDDNDDKLIVVPKSIELTDEQIEEQIAFQEKWFSHILIRNNK